MNNIFRKNTIKTLLLFSISATSTFSAFAEDSQNTFQSTALIENSCLLSADNVNFGQVFSPLTSQGSQSQMRVQCSNSAPYTIDLAYGGVYGVSNGNSAYEISYINTTASGNAYSLDDKGLKNNFGQIFCGIGSYSGKVYLTNLKVAQIYGMSSIGWQDNSVAKACTDDAKPIGWAGAYNATGRQVLGGSSYNYGVMNGGVKGDKLAYKITIPGDITKVWNVGNNSYKATRIGTEQVIAMNAQIVPSNSSSLYPAQDMYSDTVTIVISY